MLREILTTEALSNHLPQPGAWRPVPDVNDRAFWTSVEEPTRSALLAHAEEVTRAPWPVQPATLWLDFRRTGNRTRFERGYFARRTRLAAAVLAACLTDEDRWHEEVLDGVWLLCEETSWCIPAHDESHGARGGDLPNPANPTLDLFAAETGALLAWTYAVLGDRVRDRSEFAVRRLLDEVRRRVLIPQRTIDTWTWFGRTRRHVNNWNPWINSNVLACSFLLDFDRDDIVRTTERVVEGLEVFLAGYQPDGACTEGHSYWWRAGASLSECLEFLRSASGGVLDCFGLPLVREIGRYPHRVHIADRWYVNVADGPAQVDKNACAHVLYRFGVRVGDEEMKAHARAMRGDDGPAVSPGTPLGRALLALADTEWRREPPRSAPLVAQAWWPDAQLLVARQHPGRADGLLISVKGGHNAEDHNHNDVGTVLVALDGHPVLVDAGVGEYTAQTFSDRRYEIWALRSAYHNVPLIDGYEQAPGAAYAARDVTVELDSGRVHASVDLAGAYPAEAGCRRWLRTLTLDRAGEGRVTLVDSWELDHHPRDLRLHLMASGTPDTTVRGTIVVPGQRRALRVDYDAELLDVGVERIAFQDSKLNPVWGEALWRIALVVRTPAATGSVRLVMYPVTSD
ncbi:heparinase II/III domain-containing protein [Thermasporomyces composti]|jgi:hypothetical protein|uniref:Heparinase II/III-like protein n=1 Tax=Thermasporomyces composti TaxID=696763 RepID=A0A3D9VES4_THECX|nr:heparinase II/III family protein [Thermasporomyces composti]REF36644.1 heparinase II/III-like protein [Thermasporomyces composti]